MSLPPSQIRIKRKATDEPIEYFQIHHGESIGSGKRQKTTLPSGYIFSRQSAVESGPASSPLVPPPVRQIKALRRSASSQALSPSSHSPSQENLAQRSPLSQDAGTKTPKTPFGPTHTPRRFHMSRSATPLSNISSGAGQKRKAEPALFIERKTRPRSSEAEAQTQTATPQTIKPSQNAETRPGPGYPSPDMDIETTRKRPGANASRRDNGKLPPNVAPLRNARLPSGKVIPWDISTSKLAAEMQAYTLAEIGRTLSSQETKHAAALPTSPSRNLHASKFKPKVPAMRYSERHPQSKIAGEMELDEHQPAIQDEDMDIDDEDGEYIIDTYVRIPAEAMESEEKNFGLLVLERETDFEEFYREEEDSDEEDIDEEEDENAENHYTADYPDEEVASDDEYDLNAYHYRTGNASDLEEYDEADDEDHVALSDDEGDSTRYPWKVKPWMKRPEKSILDDGLEVEKKA